MTAEGTRPVRTESRVRIIKVIKSQGAAHSSGSGGKTGRRRRQDAKPAADTQRFRGRDRKNVCWLEGRVFALYSPLNNNCTP